MVLTPYSSTTTLFQKPQKKPATSSNLSVFIAISMLGLAPLTTL